MKLSTQEQNQLGQALCDNCYEYDFIVEIEDDTNLRKCEKCSEEGFEAYYE